jgi:hypothetical protein
MPTLYDIDFSKAAVQLLPPDKRFNVMIAFARVILTPIQYLRDLWFGTWRTGDFSPQYTNSTPYPKYYRVQYQKIVYESLINNNSSLPTVVTAWAVVQPNFIGMSERILFNGQVLVLTYALNKWFGTTFRQPNAISDIYINTNAAPLSPFRTATIEAISSVVYQTYSLDYIYNNPSFVAAINFTIYCPVAVYNALDTTLINNNKIFRAFVDRYVPAGITYTVTTY